MKFKYIVSLLHTMRISGFLPIMRDWQAFVRVHFIYAALQSGLLEALSRPSSKEELVEKLGAERPELLEALIDVGLSLGELSLNEGRYRIRGRRSKAVTGREGDMLSAMIEANVSYYASTYRNAAARMGGAPLGDDLAEIGGVVARFSKIADPVIRDFVADVAANRRVLRVLDAGCGSGTLLKTIHQANSRARGVGIDVDEDAVQQARENMAQWGLAGAFRIISGDIRTSTNELGGPFDLITLINVIYYFDPRERLGLLERLGSMLSPNGRLLLVSHMRSRGSDLGAANLNMVNCSLKGLAGLPDLEALGEELGKSGFRHIRNERLIPGSVFYGVCAS
jgi:2-polyprenyl-3-methyl-5-hydroxy-6-metoxy-1,4-benzoquinol methylase